MSIKQLICLSNIAPWHWLNILVLIDTLCSQGPLLEHTGTHLHKVLGDDNVLTVKFADVQKSSSTYSNDHYFTYKGIAKNGIMIGLRRYQFFGGYFFLFLSWLTTIYIVTHTKLFIVMLLSYTHIILLL